MRLVALAVAQVDGTDDLFHGRRQIQCILAQHAHAQMSSSLAVSNKQRDTFMKNRTSIKTAVAALALSALGTVLAQDMNRNLTEEQLRTQQQMQLQLQEHNRIYGHELMSQEERNVYMERLRLASNEQQRERIRNEHRERMDLRKRALNGVGNRGAGAGAGGGMGGKSPVIIPGPRGGGRN